MRPAVLAGVVLLALPAVGLAQNGPYLAVVVTDPQVRLRAGPSDNYPETGALPRGARVIVDHDEGNGWVAIEAPQGQVSWIAASFVEDFDPKRPTPRLVMVNLESGGEVSLCPSRPDQQEPLFNIRKTKLPNGTALTAVGPVAEFAGRKWYPVAPPAGDFRYVPKSAVQFDRAVTTAFNVRDTGPTIPAGGIGAPPTTTPGMTAGARQDTPARPGVNHPLWAQADAAEKDGKYDDAEKALFELARLMNQPGGDHDISNLCYTRIHTLREKRRGSNSTTAATGSGNWGPPRDDRATLLPPTKAAGGGNTGATPPGMTTGGGTLPGPASDERPRWTGSGMLVRPATVIDGQQTYALESAPGVVKVYVVEAPGVDLKPYLNRRLDVYGVQHTRKDLRYPYVVATSVQLSQ